jgi:signal transduction histidine kinase
MASAAAPELARDDHALLSLRTAARVWLPIAAITVLHYSTGMEHDWAHDVLRRMYYLPIVLAAFDHGVRGGLSAALVTSLLYLPHAFSLSPGHHHDPGGGLDKALEILLYNLVGATAGLLAGRERARRRELQRALVDQQRLTDELVRAGRLSALGEVVAGLAHEIKNPLHALAGTAEVVDPLIPKDCEERRMWELHVAELGRLSRLAERYLSFARPSPSELHDLDLRRVAEQIADLCAAEARQKRVAVDLDLPKEPVPIRGDRDQLCSLGLHIAVNAFRAIASAGETGPKGARETGRLKIAVAAEGGSALLSFDNDGPPLTDAERPQLFSPLYSGHAQGTGLGLAIVARIAEQHGGTIAADNAGLGVRFTLRVPLAA